MAEKKPLAVSYKTADSEKAISTHKALATRTENEAAKLVIEDEGTYEKAVEKLAQVKGYIKEIETSRTKITGPLLKAKTEVDNLFKPTRTKLEATRDLLSEGILSYRKKQAEEEAAKVAEIEAKVESGEMDMDEAIDATTDMNQLEKTQATKWGNATVRTIREVEITDESKIPRSYYVLDMSALRRDVLGNAAQGIAPIEVPGTKVVEKESI